MSKPDTAIAHNLDAQAVDTSVVNVDTDGNHIPTTPNGYDPATQIYHYCDQEYYEGDIIWKEIDPEDSTNFVVNIYSEDPEEFTTPVSVDYLDYRHPRLPLELDYQKVRQAAPQHQCPTCALCCRHGHIYAFAQIIYDHYLVPTYLFKVFNAICCLHNSPRFYTELTAEINGNTLANLPIRYQPGMIIDWRKEYAQRQATSYGFDDVDDDIFFSLDMAPLDPYANLEDECLTQLLPLKSSRISAK